MPIRRIDRGGRRELLKTVALELGAVAAQVPGRPDRSARAATLPCHRPGAIRVVADGNSIVAGGQDGPSSVGGVAGYLHRRVAPFMCGLALATITAMPAHAGGGPLGIDHAVDAGGATGIFARGNQTFLMNATPVLVIGTALWAGADSRFGKTAWQATDAMVLGWATSESMKRIFQRSRPSQSDSPNDWFQGSEHKSFPSGEVMQITTAVTPYILEYADENPVVWGLALLPAYDAVARVRSRAHWQSDVLTSVLIGSALGYYAHSRQTSIAVGLLPGGFTVGWSKRF